MSCEDESTSALGHPGANPEGLLQASLNSRALLSLSEGSELCPFVKTFACCSGSAVQGEHSCSCEGGLGCPVETSKEEGCNFNTVRQKMLSLAGKSLGLDLKLDSHFSCHKKDYMGLHIE